LAKSEIKEAMDSGAFDRLERRIVDVKYLEASDLDLNDPSHNIDGGTSGDESLVPVYAWVLIALGSLLSSLVLLRVILRQRSTTDDEVPFSIGEVDGDYEQSISDKAFYDVAALSQATEPTNDDDKALLPKMEDNSGEDKDLLPEMEENPDDDKAPLPRKKVTSDDDKDILPIVETVDSDDDDDDDDDNGSVPREIEVLSRNGKDLPDVEASSGEDTD
jgi:hypothetical protein